jgi:hypothetical protein
VGRFINERNDMKIHELRIGSIVSAMGAGRREVLRMDGVFKRITLGDFKGGLIDCHIDEVHGEPLMEEVLKELGFVMYRHERVEVISDPDEDKGVLERKTYYLGRGDDYYAGPTWTYAIDVEIKRNYTSFGGKRYIHELQNSVYESSGKFITIVHGT